MCERGVHRIRRSSVTGSRQQLRRQERRQWAADVDDELNGIGVDEWRYESKERIAMRMQGLS